MASEEARDWRRNLSLQERQKFMFQGKYACDVCFLVDENQEVMAHRFVLVCGSSIFEAMLSNWTYLGEEAIRISDVRADPFRQMLMFLYSEEVTLNQSNIYELLTASLRYQVTQLSELCVEYLRTNLSSSTVCSALETAIKVKDKLLCDSCLEFIADHATDVIHAEQFLRISTDTLLRVISSDSLESITEPEVFAACIQWADAQCSRRQLSVTDENRRNVLGPVLFQIRFAVMSIKEFAQVTKKSSILTAEEKAQLYELIANEGFDEDYNGPFISQMRGRQVLDDACEINRFENVQMFSGWECGPDKPAAIEVKSDKDVLLLGVGLFNVWETTSLQYIQVELMDDKGRALIDSGRVRLRPNAMANVVPVRFPRGFRISGNRKYTLRAVFGVATSYSGYCGKAQVRNEGVTFTFMNSRWSMDNTDIERGQIPVLLYKPL